jgi:hypothetical protein
MMYWIRVAGLLAFTSAVAPISASPQNSVISQSPTARPVGGVQLNLEPRSAQVFVDDQYAGIVEDFSGYYHNLALTAGDHKIEVVAQGYVPFATRVLVVPGRTLTYRLSLQQAGQAW